MSNRVSPRERTSQLEATLTHSTANWPSTLHIAYDTQDSPPALQLRSSSRSAQLSISSAWSASPANAQAYSVDQAQQTPQNQSDQSGLPARLKTGIESLSGLAMDQVRVHYNSSEPAQLHALAYAKGQEIHLAPGQERHLPHEAWHVVQQARGQVQPTQLIRGQLPINDDPSLEREADLMGARANSLAPSVSQVKQLPGTASESSEENSPTWSVGPNSNAQLKQPLSRGSQVSQLLTVNYYSNSSPTKVGTANVTESDGAIAAVVAPSDYDTGSGTSSGVREVSQQATSVFGQKFIAGHMLNNHLGGPGNQQNNITAITSGENSAHHAYVEKGAKALVKGGKTISYYTVISKRADFYNKSGTTKLAENLASELQGGYKEPTTSTDVGPITIPLGPTNGAVKKNEAATGMSPGGGSSASVPENVEIASGIADVMIEENLDAAFFTAMKTAYGMDEDDLKEAMTLWIIGKSFPSPESINKKVQKWRDLVLLHASTASPLPPFFPG